MMLLRKEDRKNLPPLYSQEKEKDPKVWVKFFTPWSNWTWYATEFDGNDTLFGWVCGHECEFGYFSLSGLQSVKGPFGLTVERDMYFRPQPLSEIKGRKPNRPDHDGFVKPMSKPKTTRSNKPRTRRKSGSPSGFSGMR